MLCLVIWCYYLIQPELGISHVSPCLSLLRFAAAFWPSSACLSRFRSRRTRCATSCAPRTWCRCGRRRPGPCSWSSTCDSWPRAAATTWSRPSVPSGSQCTSPRWEIGFPRALGSNMEFTLAVIPKEKASRQLKGVWFSTLFVKWNSVDWCWWEMDAANVPLAKGRELNYKCQSCILTVTTSGCFLALFLMGEGDSFKLNKQGFRCMEESTSVSDFSFWVLLVFNFWGVDIFWKALNLIICVLFLIQKTYGERTEKFYQLDVA